jgi:hypothetical protein
MIQFDFDWTDLLNKVILCVAIAMFPLQLWMLFKGRAVGENSFSARSVFKLALHFLLWIGIIGLITRPYIMDSAVSRKRLIAGDDVPSVFRDQLRDSLHAETIATADLGKQSADSLIVAGQDVPASLFPTLRRLGNPPVIQWIPYFGKDQLQSLHWKGIARKGELQMIDGAIELSQRQLLKIRYGRKTLDSVLLQTGANDFKLRFPVFTEGRTETELLLGDKTLDTLRFFARPADSLAVGFLLDSPDFETRSLATWLGKNGHSVRYETTLSKGLRASERINTAKEPDLIITDPGNAGNAAVRKAVNSGKCVLFINFSNPATELPAINQALGTQFAVRKISNEETVRISAELSAWPYRFLQTNFQLALSRYPVVVEKARGKVAVSLLTETFPMQLAGDSTAYGQIWNEILALARPGASQNIEIGAPVYAGTRTQIFVNDFGDIRKMLRIGSDTIFTNQSELNEKSAWATFLPAGRGWVTVQDPFSAEIYIQDEGATMQAHRMDDFVGSYQAYLSDQHSLAGSDHDANRISRSLPDWFWFTWLLLCFTALWIDAKV